MQRDMRSRLPSHRQSHGSIIMEEEELDHDKPNSNKNSNNIKHVAIGVIVVTLAIIFFYYNGYGEQIPTFKILPSIANHNITIIDKQLPKQSELPKGLCLFCVIIVQGLLLV